MKKNLLKTSLILSLVATSTFGGDREGRIGEWLRSQGSGSNSRPLEDEVSLVHEGAREVTLGRGFDVQSLQSAIEASSTIPSLTTLSLERAGRVTTSRRVEPLEDILPLRRHFSRKFFELKEKIIEDIREAAVLYASSFQHYQGGVRVYLREDPTLFEDVLLVLGKLRKLEVRNLQREGESHGSLIRLLERPLQFYRELEEIKITDMRVQEEEILELLHEEVIPNPLSLKRVELRGSPLSSEGIRTLRRRFPRLEELLTDSREENVGSSSNTPLSPEPPLERRSSSHLSDDSSQGNPRASVEDLFRRADDLYYKALNGDETSLDILKGKAAEGDKYAKAHLSRLYYIGCKGMRKDPCICFKTLKSGLWREQQKEFLMPKIY